MLVFIKDTEEQEDEPIATRMQSHDEEPIASSTLSQQGLSELAGFTDLKIGTNLNERLNEITFLTSEMSDPTDPQTFQQAWWHLDLTAREKWREGIKLEFKKMISMHIWRKVESTSIPQGRRLVGCHWIFKIKHNGIY